MKHLSVITHGERGFHWTAPNGYTLSVQYGLGNYCERRNLGGSFATEPKDANDIESKDFEMAILYPNGGFVPLEDYESVLGWMPTWALPRIMQSMGYFHNGTMTEGCVYLDGFRNTIKRIRAEEEKMSKLSTLPLDK
tara:strand:+ start:981 stop:1391 length:411 start_codon:yes stop_codon:yes gene_type:complete